MHYVCKGTEICSIFVWRVYQICRDTLVNEGIALGSITDQVFEINPYCVGIDYPHKKGISALVIGIPLSLRRQLRKKHTARYLCKAKKRCKIWKIRHPKTHGMTEILNGNCFCQPLNMMPFYSVAQFVHGFASQLLTRVNQCVNAKKCTNCWTDDNYRNNCK